LHLRKENILLFVYHNLLPRHIRKLFQDGRSLSFSRLDREHNIFNNPPPENNG
jgi:hypothetical protein